MEVLKKAGELERDLLLCFKHNIVSTLKGAAGGGVAGAVVGGGLGAVAGAGAATGTGLLVSIPAGMILAGGAVALPVAGAALAVGIPASIAWLALQRVKKAVTRNN